MKTPKDVKMYLLAAMLMALLSCNGFSQENRTPTIVKTFDLNQPGTLNARSSGGGIVVRTHDQHEVIVQVFIRKNGRLLSPSDPEIDDVLEVYDLDIAKNGSVITANVEHKIRRNTWQNTGISLTITVPGEMSCNVSSSGGGLRVSGIKGTHKLTSSGGGIDVEDITGDTEVSSSGGGVNATNQDGDIRLSSSGGGVTLNKAHGSVYAHSSGGGVHLNDVHGDVDAGSSGGGVTVTGVTGYLKATSSGGPVRINVAGLRKELYLQSSGGGISATIQNGKNLGLDLDLISDRVNIELHNFSGRVDKNTVKGTLNNGGIPVYMRSSGGNITVELEDQ